MSEKALEKWSRDTAKAAGMLSYKFSSPAQRGVPDCIFLYKGAIRFVEFKNPNGKGVVSPLQKKKISEIVAQGFGVAVIDNKSDMLHVVNSMKEERY